MKFFNLKLMAALILGFLLSFSADVTLAKSKKKKAKITFEQCCEKNGGDTKKCQKMKGVKGKKQKKGKKWAPKQCPQTTDDSAMEEDV